MKPVWTPILLCVFLFAGGNRIKGKYSTSESTPVAKNLVIITLDGIRWQDVFKGADSSILNDPDYNDDTAISKLLYWNSDLAERRKLLMPFLWKVMAKKGQMMGNRDLGNNFNISNFYGISYPGYNEMFTGHSDAGIRSNKKHWNRNLNVLEYLSTLSEFNNKVAVFASWDVFPYILNTKRNGLKANCGYDSSNNGLTSDRFTKLQSLALQEEEHTATRDDRLTYAAAKIYLKTASPRVLVIGLGEADEMAHQGKYDQYLMRIKEYDNILSDLWLTIRADPALRDNTTILLTTDHGRGSGSKTWTDHNMLVKGSFQGWMGIMGPGIPALGEVKLDIDNYLEQLAQTIACILGKKFEIGDPAPPLALQ
ncbi:MAG: alkaline phosphatase family protein [Chitinophagaceae bacterium]|nr:alkaline phosphatase family protein [Chitinophagaceae bacterium]